MEVYQDGIEVHCLPDGAVCKVDEEKRSPLDIDYSPIGCDFCTGDCIEYTEE